MNLVDFLLHSDALSRVLALLLLALSVASWVVILLQWRRLGRVGQDVPRAKAAYWQSSDPAQAQSRAAALDRDGCLQALLAATQTPVAGTLAGATGRRDQLTRALREAMNGVVQRLQWGQLLLASAGSTAPFIGLLGTVWGIFNALTGMAEAGQLTVDKIAGPVGEALVMTAFGLGVAIPAVLGYNLLGRRIGQIEAELEGFAHDLRGLLASKD